MLTSEMPNIFSIFDSISNESVREVLLHLSKLVLDFLSSYFLNEEVVDFLEQIDRNEIDIRNEKWLVRLKRYGGGSSIAPDLGGRQIQSFEKTLPRRKD